MLSRSLSLSSAPLHLLVCQIVFVSHTLCITTPHTQLLHRLSVPPHRFTCFYVYDVLRSIYFVRVRRFIAASASASASASAKPVCNQSEFVNRSKHFHININTAELKHRKEASGGQRERREGAVSSSVDESAVSAHDTTTNESID